MASGRLRRRRRLLRHLGYVIARSLWRELELSGRISLPGFYGRRVRRLLPALAAMLVVVVLIGTLAGPAATQRSGPITGVFASLSSANMYLYTLPAGYFDTSSSLNPLLHMWTLAVEEQFYLVFPMVLVVGWLLLSGRRAVLARRGTAALFLVLLSLASFLFSRHLTEAAAAEGFRPARLAFYGAPARAWELGAGAAIFLALPLLSRVPAAALRIAGLLGFGVVTAAAVGIDSTSNIGGASALPVLGCGLLLAAGIVEQAPTSRLLSLRASCWVGDRSYGWYLWHWPLIVFAVALLALVPARGAACGGACAASELAVLPVSREPDPPPSAAARARGRRARRLVHRRPAPRLRDRARDLRPHRLGPEHGQLAREPGAARRRGERLRQLDPAGLLNRRALHLEGARGARTQRPLRRFQRGPADRAGGPGRKGGLASTSASPRSRPAPCSRQGEATHVPGSSRPVCGR